LILWLLQHTHLISTSCALYLVGIAFLKGLHFTPASTLHFGLVLPLMSITLLGITVLGLVVIGAILANPLGSNRESFAVCHFLNYTCTSSLEAVSTSSAPTLARNLAETKDHSFTGNKQTSHNPDDKAIEAVKQMIEAEKHKLESLEMTRRSRAQFDEDDDIDGESKRIGRRWARLRKLAKTVPADQLSVPLPGGSEGDAEEAFVRERLSQHETMLKELEARKSVGSLSRGSQSSRNLFESSPAAGAQRGRFTGTESSANQGVASAITCAAGNVANAALRTLRSTAAQPEMSFRGRSLRCSESSARMSAASSSSSLSGKRQDGLRKIRFRGAASEDAATSIQKIVRGRSARQHQNEAGTQRQDERGTRTDARQARISPDW